MKYRGRLGFTLIEVMVVVVVLAVVLGIAIPSFRDFLLVQRLKGINAQLVTDLQMARSEAASRNTFLRINFRNATSGQALTCYSLYTVIGTPANNNGNAVHCDCRLGAGAACSTVAGATEVRTVQVLASESVSVAPTGAQMSFAFDPVTGGIWKIPTDDFSAPIDSYAIRTSIDSTRSFTTTLNRSGRPSICASKVQLGAEVCP